MKTIKTTYKHLSAVMMFTCILLLMAGCNHPGTNSVDPSSEEQSASAIITVNVGTVGQLAKKKTINLEHLVLTLSCPGQNTICDTTSISGTGGNDVQVTIDNLKAPRIWTIAAATFDTNDSCIHSGSTTFTTIPTETAEVSLSLDAKYSVLQVSFNGIPDSAATLSLTVNGEMFEAETTFTAGSLDTVLLAYDYLQVGVENTVSLKAQGVVYGKDTVLYTTNTTMNVVAGKDSVYGVTLDYVGPIEDPPEIISHPTAVTVAKGETAKFRVGVEEPGLTFQWRKGTENIDGATDSVYTTPPTTNDDHDALFRCVVTDRYGQSRLSYAGRLTVTEFVTPYMVDDFEDGDELNNLGYTWYYYDDNGGVGPNDRPQIAPSLIPSIINVPYSETERYAFGDMNDDWMIKIYTLQVEETDDNYYITMPFTFGDDWEADWCNDGETCAMPFVGIQTLLAPGDEDGIPYGNFPMLTSTTANLAGVTQISFSIKSRVNILNNVSFVIHTSEIDEYAFKPGSELKGDEWGYYGYTFTVNPGGWQSISIPIAELDLPGTWAHDFDFNIAHCTHLSWGVKADETLANVSDTLDIDNVRFE